MNYVPKHSRDHADSECASYVVVDRKRAEFIGNKQRNKLTNTHTLNFKYNKMPLI